jgi:hypothetical protein
MYNNRGTVFSARSVPMAARATKTQQKNGVFCAVNTEICYAGKLMRISQCNAAQESEEFVGELVRDVQFSRCELFLLEAGS